MIFLISTFLLNLTAEVYVSQSFIKPLIPIIGKINVGKKVNLLCLIGAILVGFSNILFIIYTVLGLQSIMLTLMIYGIMVVGGIIYSISLYNHYTNNIIHSLLLTIFGGYMFIIGKKTKSIFGPLFKQMWNFKNHITPQPVTNNDPIPEHGTNLEEQTQVNEDLMVETNTNEEDLMSNTNEVSDEEDLMANVNNNTDEEDLMANAPIEQPVEEEEDLMVEESTDEDLMGMPIQQEVQNNQFDSYQEEIQQQDDYQEEEPQNYTEEQEAQDDYEENSQEYQEEPIDEEQQDENSQDYQEEPQNYLEEETQDYSEEQDLMGDYTEEQTEENTQNYEDEENVEQVEESSDYQEEYQDDNDQNNYIEEPQEEYMEESQNEYDVESQEDTDSAFEEENNPITDDEENNYDGMDTSIPNPFKDNEPDNSSNEMPLQDLDLPIEEEITETFEDNSDFDNTPLEEEPFEANEETSQDEFTEESAEESVDEPFEEPIEETNEESPEGVKKGRGRPRKYPKKEIDPNAPKRGRGRPRKNENIEEENDN